MVTCCIDCSSFKKTDIHNGRKMKYFRIPKERKGNEFDTGCSRKKNLTNVRIKFTMKKEKIGRKQLKLAMSILMIKMHLDARICKQISMKLTSHTIK